MTDYVLRFLSLLSAFAAVLVWTMGCNTNAQNDAPETVDSISVNPDYESLTMAVPDPSALRVLLYCYNDGLGVWDKCREAPGVIYSRFGPADQLFACPMTGSFPIEGGEGEQMRWINDLKQTETVFGPYRQCLIITLEEAVR